MSQTHSADALFSRGLKINHLRLMAALAQTGQIGQAAARLGITQPAASRLMAEMERIAGAPLHERTGRGIGLTALGQVLARRAQRMMMELSDTARELGEFRGGLAGEVRIGSVTAPALDMVLPALRTARMSHPGIRAEVTVATSDILCAQLLDGRLDFVLGRVPPAMDASLFDMRIMAPEPVALMVRRDHRLAGRRDLRPAELLEFDWVMPGPETLLASTVLSRLAALGLPPPPQRLATASFLLTLALLQQSNSIAPLAQAVADRFAATPEAPYAVLDIDIGLEVVPFGLLTRAGAALTPAAQALADLVTQAGPAAPAQPPGR